MFDIQRIKERAKLIKPILVPLIFYMGLLVFSLSWVEDHPHSTWNLAIALSPMLPGIFIALGIAKAISKLDELERQTLLEGMSISFMVTLLLVISLGLLEMNGFPGMNGTLIGLVMIVFWLVGKLWAMSKYHEE